MAAAAAWPRADEACGGVAEGGLPHVYCRGGRDLGRPLAPCQGGVRNSRGQARRAVPLLKEAKINALTLEVQHAAVLIADLCEDSCNKSSNSTQEALEETLLPSSREGFRYIKNLSKTRQNCMTLSNKTQYMKSRRPASSSLRQRVPCYCYYYGRHASDDCMIGSDRPPLVSTSIQRPAWKKTYYLSDKPTAGGRPPEFHCKSCHRWPTALTHLAANINKSRSSILTDATSSGIPAKAGLASIRSGRSARHSGSL